MHNICIAQIVSKAAAGCPTSPPRRFKGEVALQRRAGGGMRKKGVRGKPSATFRRFWSLKSGSGFKGWKTPFIRIKKCYP